MSAQAATARSIRFVVSGHAVPAQRMTQRSKWSRRSRRSLDYQAAVAWAAKAAAGPGTTFLGPVELTCRFVFASKVHGDLGNLTKSVEDGLQYGRIVANDKQIVRYGQGHGVYYGPDERVEIELRVIGP